MKFNNPVKDKLICQVTGQHYISLRKNFIQELNNQLDNRVITQCENQLYTQLYTQLNTQLANEIHETSKK